MTETNTTSWFSFLSKRSLKTLPDSTLAHPLDSPNAPKFLTPASLRIGANPTLDGLAKPGVIGLSHPFIPSVRDIFARTQPIQSSCDSSLVQPTQTSLTNAARPSIPNSSPSRDIPKPVHYALPNALGLVLPTVVSSKLLVNTFLSSANPPLQIEPPSQPGDLSDSAYSDSDDESHDKSAASLSLPIDEPQAVPQTASSDRDNQSAAVQDNAPQDMSTRLPPRPADQQISQESHVFASSKSPVESHDNCPFLDSVNIFGIQIGQSEANKEEKPQEPFWSFPWSSSKESSPIQPKQKSRFSFVEDDDDEGCDFPDYDVRSDGAFANLGLNLSSDQISSPLQSNPMPCFTPSEPRTFPQSSKDAQSPFVNLSEESKGNDVSPTCLAPVENRFQVWDSTTSVTGIRQTQPGIPLFGLFDVSDDRVPSGQDSSWADTFGSYSSCSSSSALTNSTTPAFPHNVTETSSMSFQDSSPVSTPSSASNAPFTPLAPFSLYSPHNTAPIASSQSEESVFAYYPPWIPKPTTGTSVARQRLFSAEADRGFEIQMKSHVPQGIKVAAVCKSEERTPSSQESHSKEENDQIKSLCVFFINGSCRFGSSCRNIHGMICETCEKPMLYPNRPDLNEAHQTECYERFVVKQERHMTKESTCEICFQKPFETHRKFGLLSGCDHIFCLECIRDYRTIGTKACPLCGMESQFVVPSDRLIQDPIRKERVVDAYRSKLSAIPCRNYETDQTCPFGANCFYSHRDRSVAQLQATPYPAPLAHQAHQNMVNRTYPIPIGNPSLLNYPSQTESHTFPSPGTGNAVSILTSRSPQYSMSPEDVKSSGRRCINGDGQVDVLHNARIIDFMVPNQPPKAANPSAKMIASQKRN